MSHIILARFDREIAMQSSIVDGLRAAIDDINTDMASADEAERWAMRIMHRMITEMLSKEERSLSALREMRRTIEHEQEVAEWARETSMS